MWIVECPRCHYESDLAGFDAKAREDGVEVCFCPECGKQFENSSEIEDLYELEEEYD